MYYTATKKNRNLNYQFDNTIYAVVEKKRDKERNFKRFLDKNKESLKKIEEIYNLKK